MLTTKTILSRILFILYILAIGVICFISSSSVPDMQRTVLGVPVDKLIHFGMFFPFPILSFLSFDHPKKKGKSVLFVFITALIGCIIAVCTEMVQYYLPTRAAEMHDLICDAVAIVSCSILVLIVDLTR